MEQITLDTFSQILRGGAGLIVGPSQTLGNRSLNDIVDEMTTVYSIAPAPNYMVAGSAAIAAGFSESAIRNTITTFIGTKRPSPVLNTLSTVRWSAILSLCLDTYLEDKLQQESDRRAARRKTITVDNDLASPIPPSTVPAFKLLGSAYRNDFPVNTIDYLKRRST